MKFMLTDNVKIVNGHTLYQICATENKGLVRVGELGGFIESAKNLSQEGACWIKRDSIVFGSSRITDDARVVNSTIIDTNVFGGSYIVGSKLTDSIVHDSHIVDTRVIKSHLMNVGCFGEKPANLYDSRLENTTLAGLFKFESVEIGAPCNFIGPIHMSDSHIKIPIVLHTDTALHINNRWTIDVRYETDQCVAYFTNRDTNRTICRTTEIDCQTWS